MFIDCFTDNIIKFDTITNDIKQKIIIDKPSTSTYTEEDFKLINTINLDMMLAYCLNRFLNYEHKDDSYVPETLLNHTNIYW